MPEPSQLTVDGRETRLAPAQPSGVHDAPPLFAAPQTIRGQLAMTTDPKEHSTMTSHDPPCIDWAKIRDVNDVILPVPFSEEDVAANVGDVDFGTRVIDREGNRFLVMGHGSVQGSVILRDRYRRMFHADIDTRVRVAS
jgi:hypothetical protein